MHARSIALCAALALSVVTCEAPTGPSLSGTWVFAYQNLGGGWVEFTLNDAGGALNGKVFYRGIVAAPVDSSLVTGTRASTSVRLQFTWYGGTPTIVTGRLATVALYPRADTLFIAAWVQGSDTLAGPFYPLVRGQ